MKRVACGVAAIALGLALGATAFAQPPSGPAPDVAPGAEVAAEDAIAELTPEQIAEIEKAKAEFEAKLDHHTGRVVLPDAHVTLNVPDGFYFLDKEDTRAVLEDAWSNPPDSTVAGMLFPNSGGPFAEHSWGAVLTFEDTGYVSDEDANGIDYDMLIDTMREHTQSENAQRKQMGFPTTEIIGWATQPRYDARTHKLYWAKELSFEGEATHTLNYDMRVLGREGVLSINFVAGIEELAAVERDSASVLAIPEFDSGYRYADFNASTDKKADYGVVGLIAGGATAAALAKKAGILGVLIPLLAKFWYAIVAVFLGIVAGIRNLFTGGKSKKAAGPTRVSGVDTSFFDGAPEAPPAEPPQDKPPSSSV